MTAYYNEFEPYAAQWLRNLIAAGHIAPGEVDERNIQDVKATDLAGFTQCHFFAGIGGWSYALRLADWPDDRPVWTGSCPCQPFSAAGRQTGQDDPRHLWPTWKNLIAKRKPATVFGEQVASAIAHGWLDEIAVDLEKLEYAIAAAVIPACAAGAFHRRDRLWFVADASGEQDHQKQQRPTTDERRRRPNGFSGCGLDSVKGFALGDPYGVRSQGGAHKGLDAQGWEETGRPAGLSGSDIEWLTGPDRKSRAVKSGLCLLAHGVPARVGRLRAYGNAIDPRPASEFIKAFIQCEC